MPRKPRPSSPPSLYVKVPGAQIDLADLHTVQPSAAIRRIEERAESVAAAAERGGLGDHAAEIREHLEWLTLLRNAGETDAVIVKAIMLGAAVERTCAQAELGPAVHSYRSSRRKSPVTDEDVIAAVAKFPKPKDAAAELGISERLLRDRRARIRRKAAV